MKTISVASMRSLDERTIADGTPGFVLMERAGLCAYQELTRFLGQRLAPVHRRSLTVVAGKGNNGGDAYVVARHAAEHGAAVTVYAACAPTQLSGAAREHAAALGPDVPVVICDELPRAALAPGTVLIDGLLGTGVSGPLRPPYERLIAQINASNLPVISLDIPSGLDGDTGAIATDAVVADLTVTMAQPKQGLVTENGLRHCGALRCVDIGIPSELLAEAPAAGEAIFQQDVTSLLTRRPHDAHKGTFGHVLVVGGSRLYVGAPFLAGAAALRAGAGLATVAVPESARRLATVPLNALIVSALPDTGDGFFSEAASAELEPLLDRAQAVVVGPGIGRETQSAAVLRRVLATDLPVIIDADALRLLSEVTGWSKRDAVTILTPHPGEMRAVLAGCGLEEYISCLRSDQALALARRHGVFVALKGMGTVLACPDGVWAINTSGSNALATGGSGDVLAGILGGMLAQGFPAWDALRVGTFVHGLAAELSPCGARSLSADDLLALIGPAFRELTPFA